MVPTVKPQDDNIEEPQDGTIEEPQDDSLPRHRLFSPHPPQSVICLPPPPQVICAPQSPAERVARKGGPRCDQQRGTAATGPVHPQTPSTNYAPPNPVNKSLTPNHLSLYLALAS
jgi:hypothetical protein